MSGGLRALDSVRGVAQAFGHRGRLVAADPRGLEVARVGRDPRERDAEVTRGGEEVAGVDALGVGVRPSALEARDQAGLLVGRGDPDLAEERAQARAADPEPVVEPDNAAAVARASRLRLELGEDSEAPQ